MQTSKPLKALVPELLSYITKNYQGQIVYQRKLLDIWNGNLLKYVEENLAKELNPRAYERSKGRIPPINITRQVIEKLSRVYSEPALRDAGENTIDVDLLAYYERELDVDNQLNIANELLNLNKYFAIEPYLDAGIPDMRILPADKFMVWSDNPNDPTAMTVFIKFMGSRVKAGEPVTDSNGRALKGAENALRDVAVYHMYTNTEFLMVDADGEVMDERPNPYGKIPFIYCSNSTFELIPTPDSDTLAMAVLIPTLLTDLNYATQFLSHSIIYGIDIDPQNLDNSPDAFWVIPSIPGEGKTPSIGTIKPEVDTEKVISLINSQMSMWLDSKGLKTGSVGSPDAGNAASGVSKLIDEADASASHRKQTALFRRYEKDLWSLVNVMHDYWVSTQQMKDQTRAFSTSFRPSLKFGESKVIVDTKVVLEEIKILFELNLITPELALRKLNPDFTDEQISLLLREVEAFKAKTAPVVEVEPIVEDDSDVPPENDEAA